MRIKSDTFEEKIMPLTKKQEKKYKKSKKRCHIWKEEFDENEKNDGEI